MENITNKDELLEQILNELDHTFHDEAFEKKINGIIKRGKAYLNDKFGSEINFAEDGIAMELLVSYCRYGRSGENCKRGAGEIKCDRTVSA